MELVNHQHKWNNWKETSRYDLLHNSLMGMDAPFVNPTRVATYSIQERMCFGCGQVEEIKKEV